MKVTDLIRMELLRRLEISEPPKMVSIHRLRATEWSKEFEKLQRNRMITGALRYGQLGQEGKPKYDRCSDMIRRLELYKQGGNLEHLVDVANLCMCEFVEGDQANRHFSSSDDGVHTKEKK